MRKRNTAQTDRFHSYFCGLPCVYQKCSSSGGSLVIIQKSTLSVFVVDSCVSCMCVCVCSLVSLQPLVTEFNLATLITGYFDILVLFCDADFFKISDYYCFLNI